MKRTLLSLSVALACSVSHSTFAASSSDDEMSFWDEAGQFGGSIGALGYTYEVKTERNTDGTLKAKTTTKITDIINLTYANAPWNLTANYLLQTQDTRKVNGAGDTQETTDSYKHTLGLIKGFNFTHGWSSKLGYSLVFTDTEYDQPGLNLNGVTRKHTITPSISYWNNDYNAGATLSVDYTETTVDNNYTNWGIIETDAYAFTFEPSMRYDNWKFAVKFYYQKKDEETNKYASASDYAYAKSEAKEYYYEPSIQYAFEDAGTLYLNYRIGKEEAEGPYEGNGAWGAYKGETKYTSDIRKATLGYQQTITQDWEIKAEYEYSENKKLNSGASKTENTEQSKFYVSAAYRF